jgi:prefoldin subunit 5
VTNPTTTFLTKRNDYLTKEIERLQNELTAAQQEKDSHLDTIKLIEENDTSK